MPSREELERLNRERDHALEINKEAPGVRMPPEIPAQKVRTLKSEVLELIDAKLVEYAEYGVTVEALKDLKARISAL